jgi:hypoxanthine phosphoribosyltransferase
MTALTPIENPIEKDLWVDWNAYYATIESLVAQVAASGWEFDCLLCLARGGLRIGDVFSRVFEKPLAILAASSYRDNAGFTQGNLDIGEYITITRGQLANRVLLLDDLVDSGVTFSQVAKHLRQRYPAITSLKTAVLWYKAASAVKPDYYVEYLPHNPWVHQPFEHYDKIRPADLLKGIDR